MIFNDSRNGANQESCFSNPATQDSPCGAATYGSEEVGVGAVGLIAPPCPANLGTDVRTRSLMRRGVTTISSSVSFNEVLRFPNAYPTPGKFARPGIPFSY